MKQIGRLTDKVTDHSCGDAHTNNTIISASNDVFCNGLGVVRDGDKVSCDDTILGSSQSVFIDGKPVSGVSDPTTFHFNTCTPAFIDSGSDDVYFC